MLKRNFFSLLVSFFLSMYLGGAFAQENAFKIGLILPLSGPFSSTGKQLESAARLYIAQHGETIGGQKLI